MNQFNNPRRYQQRCSKSYYGEIGEAQATPQTMTGKLICGNAEDKCSEEKWTNHRTLLRNLD